MARSIAIYYLCHILPPVRDAARACGYAIGLHGSVERDLDLIAVPWTTDAKPAEDLVEAIRAAVSGYVEEKITYTDGREGPNPESKAHGRRAWNIRLGGVAYIDLSVMPRLAEAQLEGVGPCRA